MADLPPPVPAIEVALSSRGMSKGLAQTTGPQFLARGELAFGRIYVGAYVKNLDSSTADGEAAALAGVRTTVAGFELNASAGWKRAIDPTRGSDANALEVSASATRKIGRLTPRVSIVWSPNDVGGTGRTTFVETGVGFRLSKSLSAAAALGRRERSGGPDYFAWNAGVAWTPHKKITFDARYYDTDGGDAQPFRPRAVVAARLKF